MSTKLAPRNDGARHHHARHWFTAFVDTRRRLLLILMGVATLIPLTSALCVDSRWLVQQDGRHSRCARRPMTTLHATPPNGGRSSSSTARESATHVEWEPLTELQRRIEDGVHYEHWPDDDDVYDEDSRVESEVEPERVQGVFFGYRVTREDYERLRSADPNEPETYYDI